MSEAIKKSEEYEPKILIISTVGSYVGIDNAGGSRMDYSTNTYVMKVPDPILFKVEFYIKAYKMGYDGILLASDGNDGPYKNTFPRLTERVAETIEAMKEEGIEYQRIKLTAICTVCHKHFVRELNSIINAVKDLGPVGN